MAGADDYFGPQPNPGKVFGGVYDPDRQPTVTVDIGPLGGKMITYARIEEYSYDTDVLQLGDPFAFTLGNPDGVHSGAIHIGDTVKFYVSHPVVTGGARVLKLTGIVTAIDMSADPKGGDKIMITGADLGWHLANNTGPLFHRYRSKSINAILADVLDPSWQFQGVRSDNDINRRAKLGRAGVIPQAQAYQFVPPIQWEPGMNISDVLIPLARRQKLLLNVSADGWMQFFKPNYTQSASYVFHHHRIKDGDQRLKNNIKSARLKQSLDGVYTQVTCVGQVAYPPYATSVDPNAGRKRGDFNAPAGTLPFVRKGSFSDADQFDTAAAQARAQWKWQRGQFDSWVYEITVPGHVHMTPTGQAVFYEADTMATVDDTVFQIPPGNYYVSACHYKRTQQNGTETTLTLHKPGVLGA